MIQIYSWNVNGIRAILKKNYLEWFEKTQPDLLCLQETKAAEEQVAQETICPPGYHAFWSSSKEKKGYSGVLTFSKHKPLAVQEGFGIGKFDQEGRVIVTEFNSFILYNVYFPNGQQSEERLNYKLEFYDRFLAHLEETRKRKKNLIICGDYNIAHHPIDLKNPDANSDRSGFLPIERAILDKMQKLNYIDTFREFNQEPDQYSWWSYRHQARKKNIGWRIDYFFTTNELQKNLKAAQIHSEVEGSDHCPISLTVELKF